MQKSKSAKCLVRLISEKQVLVIVTKNNKYLNSIVLFLTFWNQTLFSCKYYLQVIGTIIAVNKNLEYKFMFEEKSIVWYKQFSCKKSVVFGSNSLKMSVSFDKNF